MNYIKFLNYLRSFDKELFEVTSKEQKEFLSTMKEPVDDIDRSFNQFRGRHFFLPYTQRNSSRDYFVLCFTSVCTILLDSLCIQA